MTTPTRSMARMAHSPPSPPPSAARLEQESDCWDPPTWSLIRVLVGLPSLFSPVVVPAMYVQLSSIVGHIGHEPGVGVNTVVRTGTYVAGNTHVVAGVGTGVVVVGTVVNGVGYSRVIPSPTGD